ncbi:MAG: sigma-70 family RNA polymerase sigma factor [Clostridiales bacterium]|nr:sigma-70 family RNA polymerase sigma factor [Clostridiales bacterium]
MNDTNIIDLYFRRDEDAISETIKSYNGRLLRFASRFLSDKRDAEECVNDAYVRAWNTIPPTRPDNLFAYLAALCRNSALDVIKKNTAQKRSAQLVELTSEMNECIPDQSLADDRSDEIAEYINEYLGILPREKRVVFVGRYWYNESISDISKKTGFSQSKVKTMLHRMREDLREYIDRKDGSQ